ncbi:hypothetical protein A9K55_009159 [Cordyceps militaris]|uniref:Uncharacterized protein n=1 Tax=Cordyceps militaris TaxID=73501 RepID=A0A2H4SHJ1_CORMI|nr:hypothetical protein A9K55_009159 [Cordyceps militaris]
MSKDVPPDRLSQELRSEDISFAAAEVSVERRRKAKAAKLLTVEPKLPQAYQQSIGSDNHGIVSPEQELTTRDLSFAAAVASNERHRKAKEAKLHAVDPALPQADQSIGSDEHGLVGREQDLTSRDLSFAAAVASTERRRKAKEAKDAEAKAEIEKRRYELGVASFNAGHSSRERRKRK